MENQQTPIHWKEGRGKKNQNNMQVPQTRKEYIENINNRQLEIKNEIIKMRKHHIRKRDRIVVLHIMGNFPETKIKKN